MTKQKKERAPVSNDNFKARVAGVVKSGKSIRGNIQELVLFAMVAYLDPDNNGNASNLSYLYNQVAGVKSLNHRLLSLYVEDSINVKLGKTSEGDSVFRKAVKGEAPALRDGADLTANWWEHGRVTAPKAIDIFKQIDTLRKSIAATMGDEAKRDLIAGQELVAEDAISMLTDMATKLSGLAEQRAEEKAALDAEESATPDDEFVGPTLAMVA